MKDFGNSSQSPFEPLDGPPQSRPTSSWVSAPLEVSTTTTLPPQPITQPNLANRTGARRARGARGWYHIIVLLLFLARIGASIWRSMSRSGGATASPVTQHVNRGQMLAQGGNYQGAIGEYDAAIAANAVRSGGEEEADAPDAYVGRANAYQQTGRNDLALSDYSTYLGLRPTDTDALYNRGMLYAGKHDYKHALADLNRVISLKPKAQDLTDAYEARADVYYHLNDAKHALADLDECRVFGGQPNPDLVAKVKALQPGAASTAGR